MPIDNDVDYRALSREQLGEALENIDAARFPKNHEHLLAEIAARDTGRVHVPPSIESAWVTGAKLECCRDMASLVLFVVLALAMIGLGFFCFRLPGTSQQLVGALGISFFGFGLVSLIRQSLMEGPVVTIDGDSIFDRRSFQQPLKWTEVDSVWVSSIQFTKFLCVLPKDPDQYVQSLSTYRRVLATLNDTFGYPPVTLTFGWLSPGVKEVFEYIRHVQPSKVAA